MLTEIIDEIRKLAETVEALADVHTNLQRDLLDSAQAQLSVAAQTLAALQRTLAAEQH